MRFIRWVTRRNDKATIKASESQTESVNNKNKCKKKKFLLGMLFRG